MLLLPQEGKFKTNAEFVSAIAGGLKAMFQTDEPACRVGLQGDFPDFELLAFDLNDLQLNGNQALQRADKANKLEQRIFARRLELVATPFFWGEAEINFAVNASGATMVIVSDHSRRRWLTLTDIDQVAKSAQ